MAYVECFYYFSGRSSLMEKYSNTKISLLSSLKHINLTIKKDPTIYKFLYYNCFQIVIFEGEDGMDYMPSNIHKHMT